jgi:hyperosmotically inducible periplasmic protein
MNLRLAKTRCLMLAVALLVPAFAVADSPDSWITTKAKLALLTADDVSATSVNVDTVNGNVTLHGKVRSEAEKERAEASVKGIDGVKSVKNLLQVVPEAAKDNVNVSDDRIKEKVESSIKTDPSLKDVKVASVNKGVVLLSGKSDSLASKLKAVETAYKVDGVKRVATEIETQEK